MDRAARNRRWIISVSNLHAGSPEHALAAIADDVLLFASGNLVRRGKLRQLEDGTVGYTLTLRDKIAQFGAALSARGITLSGGPQRFFVELPPSTKTHDLLALSVELGAPIVELVPRHFIIGNHDGPRSDRTSRSMSDAPRALPPPSPFRSQGGPTSVLSILGFAAGAVPIPFVPSLALRRVRGALVHDIAGRHGLCFTEEGRKEMAEPSRTISNGAFLATAAFLARRTLRRFGVLGILPPLTAWLEVYALGLLFQRYLEHSRSSRTLRIHDAEARRIRRAIDRAISRAMSWNLSSAPGVRAVNPPRFANLPTRLFDGILLATAALPEHLRRRLEAAFDAALDEDPLEV